VTRCSPDETDRTDGSNAVDLPQSCGGLLECDGHLRLDIGQARVNSAQFPHEVPGEFLAGAFGRRFGSDRSQQRRGGLGSERQRSTAGR
jgi:hypothetical protein